MAVREFQEQDINRVMEIWLSSTIKAHSFIPEDFWNKNYSLVKESYLPAAKTYIYDKDKEILGFISLIDKTHIGALFIDTDYQGTGIGTLLLNFVKAVYPVLSLAVYKKIIEHYLFIKKPALLLLLHRPTAKQVKWNTI